MTRRRFPASTWFLAGLAVLCAAGVGVVALGWGNRIHRLPDAPSLIRALPKPQLRRLKPRLGPVSQYKVVEERPLFSADRRPAPAVDVEAEVPVDLDFTLFGVIITDKLNLAILRDRGNKTTRARLNEGIEAAPSWRLVELKQKQAVFEGPGGKKTLDLWVFDGTGGEAPTSVSHASPASISTVVERPPEPEPTRASRRGANSTVRPQKAPPDVDAQATSIRQRIETQRKKLRQNAANH